MTRIQGLAFRLIMRALFILIMKVDNSRIIDELVEDYENFVKDELFYVETDHER